MSSITGVKAIIFKTPTFIYSCVVYSKSHFIQKGEWSYYIECLSLWVQLMTLVTFKPAKHLQWLLYFHSSSAPLNLCSEWW